MTENRVVRWADLSVKAGVSLFIALPLLSNLLYTLASLFGGDGYSPVLAILVFLAFAGMVYTLTAWPVPSKLLRRVPEKKFLLWAVGGSFIAGLLSIFLIDTRLEGDFLLYHDTALRICSGDYSFSYILSNFTNLYIRRALLNLVPAYILPFPDLMTIQIVNVFLNIATGLMLFDVVKYGLKSRLTARISLVVFFLVPITYLTMNLPSHDIAGLFWLMLCIFIFRQVHQRLNEGRRISGAILMAMALGPLMLVLQLSRSMGVFLFYSICIMLAMQVFFGAFRGPSGFGKNRVTFILVLYLLPLSIYFVLNSFANPGNISRGSARMMFISNDTKHENRGAFDDIFDYRRYYNLIGAEEREAMARGKLASEIYYNYSDYLRLLLRKSNHLFSLGEDMTWARTENPSLPDHTVTLVFLPINRAFRILLYGLALIGLLALLKKYKLSNPIFLLLLTGMLCSVLLIIFGEINPRYSYLFLPHLTVLAAAGFAGLPGIVRQSVETVMHRPAALLRRAFPFLAVVCAAGLLLIGLKPISARIFGKSELVYRDLGSARVVIPDDPGNTFDAIVPMIPQEKPLKFGLKTLPGQDYAEVEWNFRAEPGRNYTIRGFVRENNRLNSDSCTRIFAEDVMIFPGKKLMDKAALKYNKGYAVKYFSFSPIFVQKDSIQIRMVLSREGCESYLEFLQIVSTDPEAR